MGCPDKNLLDDLKLDPQSRKHTEKTFSTIPTPYHSDISAVYEQKFNESSLRDANLYFLNLQGQVAPAFNFSDEALELKADRLARECGKIARKKSLEEALLFVANKGMDAPTATTETGLKKRLGCEIWWKRQLFKKQDREQELFALKAGIVGKFQIYCSNASHKRIQARQERSRQIMAKKEAVYAEGTEDEQVINMLELLDGSLANPKNRFAEIYTRAKGFEAYGDENGHSCQLITITCPSRMHPCSDEYEGMTPREAQYHLRDLWNEANASFKDNKIYPYGFRVAEAHKDGCPHWHIWLYVPDDQQAKLNSILEDHAFRVDGEELGADKHRITFKAIDLSKGSASSYLFKYISKNIAGFGVGEDYEADGQDAKDTAPRVRSWASIWGIRQIQQVGGSSVGVWRELRRCKDELTGILEEARICAHDGDWNGYFKLQGGHRVPRRKQPIKTLKKFNVDTETGEIELNYYGEPIERVKGLFCDGEEVITRLKEWTIRDIDSGEEIIFESVPDFNLLEVNPENTIDYPFFYDDHDLNLSNPFLRIGGESCDPWTINSNSRE